MAFADALAAGLLERAGGDPLALARTQLLLPNRRAVSAITAAFVRAAAGGGVLLPRLTPLGDVDADEAPGSFADAVDAVVPPAIDPLARQFRLAALLRGASPSLPGVEALRLAGQLARAIDTLDVEETPRSRLKDFVPAGLARHQQATVAALRPVLDAWPALLAAEGLSDPAARRAALIEALTARWAISPPVTPVIAAGILAAPPATARLLALVARLPGGMVVLPGLDTAMPQAEWDAIGLRGAVPHADAEEHGGRDAEDHPQHAPKLLLHRMRVARGEVRLWPASSPRDGPPERGPVIAEAMAPAAFTGGWRQPASLPGVRAIVAATPAEEAQAIAIALRHALETPGRTAALVTPDRNLARRVAAHLRRWRTAVDDSAGVPLRLTPPGALLLLAAEAAHAAFAPVQLLAVLKHPLVAAAERLPWLDRVRRLDLALRGVRPAPGLPGIRGRLPAPDDDLAAWWGGTAALLRPLATAFVRPAIDLAQLAGVLRDTCEALVGERLWRGAAGRALATFIADLLDHGPAFGPIEPGEAPGLLAALMGDVAVREPFGRSSRLAILGLLEARLQRADLMILGGLNEGVWPSRPAPDPWLPPALRREAGLPGERYQLGLAAHDLVQALGAPEVLLTRARRDETAPTVPSRLWLRLAARAGEALVHDDALLARARALDAAGAPRPAPRPVPAPPAMLRPRRLSVTAAELLRQDPYSFYARHVLRLKLLDALDQPPTPAEKGNDIHKILERFVNEGDDADAARLDAIATDHLSRWRDHPRMHAIWLPRVREALGWAAGALLARRVLGWRPLAAEAAGEAVFGEITLHGKADRIDADAHGAVSIIDYKTGGKPTRKAVAAAFVLQFGLLGALARRGVLASGGRSIAGSGLAGLELWKLSGGKQPGEVMDLLNGKDLAESAEEHVARILRCFTELTATYLLGDAPFTAKLHPEHAKRTDYDQLARVGEWRNRPETRP